jgi:hypothetical protein
MVDVGMGARRGGAVWWVLAAVLCALVAGSVAVRAVTAARRETPVVIARVDVPPLTRVTGGDVAVVEMPAAALPAGALRTSAAAVGHFTRMGLVPGEMLTAAEGTAALRDCDREQFLWSIGRRRWMVESAACGCPRRSEGVWRQKGERRIQEEVGMPPPR